MTNRRIAAALLLVTALAACGSDSDEANGISVDKPIGVPAPGPAPEASLPVAPSVAKSASIRTEVASKDLDRAAQTVVDVATSPKVGGFLVSSVIDLDSGYGNGNILVKVPANTFEQVVADIGAVGALRHQQLDGQDLTADVLRANAAVHRAHRDVASLLTRLEAATDARSRFEIRSQLQTARDRLAGLQDRKTYDEARTAYSPVEVTLTASRPPPAPDKPVVAQALETATSITMGILSGALLVAAVVVPLGIFLLLGYLGLAPLVRRLRPRPTV
jgi:hypothetical protein